MTLQELSRNITLHKRLQTLETTLAALEAAPPLSGQEITGMPRGTAVGDPVFALVREFETLREEIDRIRMEVTELEAEIKTFLFTVNDVIIRVVLRIRFLERCSWNETAKFAGYGADKGERVRQMIHRYFNVPAAESSVDEK
jgi:uncharacterized protein (UPF0335 family)